MDKCDCTKLFQMNLEICKKDVDISFKVTLRIRNNTYYIVKCMRWYY